MNNTSNKTIAKNSVFLYLRTVFSILVSLYTSRLFLEYLGVEDFGIYNLVGGIITLFSVLQNLLAGATQRYLNIDIGKGDTSHEMKLLNISITIHIFLSFLVLILGETFGFLFLKNVLVVPDGKETIAVIVYHISVVTTALSLLRTPYSALIIASEKMSFFAYISIAEIIGRLLITISLLLFHNKLIAFSALLFILTALVVYLHIIYCKNKITLPSYKYYKYKENQEYHDLLSFSAWTIVGNGASVARDQGLSFIFNIFHGVVLNAVMGIVNQISNVYSTLFSNIQMAFMPQITQTSENDNDRYSELVCKCTQYSFVLMGVVCIPMIAFVDQILYLWLGNAIPQYTGMFVQIIMIKILVVSLSQSLYQSLVAVAKIKQIQIYFVILSSISILLAYLLLRCNVYPTVAMLIVPIMDLIMLIIRLYYVKIFTCIKIKQLFVTLIKPVIFVTLLIPCALYLSSIDISFVQLLLFLFIFISIYSLFTWYFVLQSEERSKVIYLIRSK